MKWLRTLVLFDQGLIAVSTDWADIHESYVASIKSIDFPAGSGRLTLRKKERTSSGQWLRNGVVYLKTRFLSNMTQVQGWNAEGGVDLNRNREQEPIKLYPSGQIYNEPITSDFGGFDFVTVAKGGLRVAIEWETGNISSSHRSMNKLAIALRNGAIDAGVLIVPSRQCYDHLTDRIGNISELSGYLSMWAGLSGSINKGLLAISVVGQDDLTDDPTFPYLPTGNDGRAREGRAKRL